MAGADLLHCLPLVNQFFRSSPERHGKLPTLNQCVSPHIHHNGKKATYHSGPLTTTALLPVTFLPVMGSVSWSNGQSINLAPGEYLF